MQSGGSQAIVPPAYDLVDYEGVRLDDFPALLERKRLEFAVRVITIQLPLLRSEAKLAGENRQRFVTNQPGLDR